MFYLFHDFNFILVDFCRLISIGTDGAATFMGIRVGVTTIIWQKLVPFAIGVYCVAHRTNLCVQMLSAVPVVHNMEELCQLVYTYFSKSPKRHLEFLILVDLMKTKGNRVLQNVQTQWIFCLGPIQQLLQQYQPLLMKMGLDGVDEQGSAAVKNFDILCDIQVLLSMICLVPLLEVVYLLI